MQFEESKSIRDKNGRYIIIQGKLFNKPVVLANVYAPNWDDVDFFRNLFSLLPGLDSHELILGGDLNCVLDSVLDCSGSKVTTPNKSASCINTFLQAYGVVDPWRCKYPNSKQFSFFSPVHQTYSRIDCFFNRPKTIAHNYTGGIQQYSHIRPLPSTFEAPFPENILRQRVWRLNPRLLLSRNQ